MPNHNPDEIMKMVDSMELKRTALHERMDHDMDLYHQEPYKSEELEGYKHYTSNNPTTAMDLAMHLGGTSRRIIRVHQPRAQKEDREVNNFKELFCIGVIEQANERRSNLLMPGLNDALFAQSLFRGRIAQRVLLVKEELDEDEKEEVAEGWDPLGIADVPLEQLPPEALEMEAQMPPPETRTYVDITDWDPRNTYWAMGKHGLEWACHKEYKSRQQILAEYGVDPAEGEPEDRPPQDDDEKEYPVYDFFDAEDNMVFLGS